MIPRSRLLLLVGALLFLVLASHGRGTSDLPTAYDTLRKVYGEIHVGMTADDARHVAEAEGARVRSIGFISEPPAPGEAANTAPDSYSLFLGIPVTEDPGFVSISVHIRNGRVDKVSPVTPPEP
ncbi:hypothetical protein [Nitrospirillum sp. BR 11828]|uniref:hypothetical protein n=1 Tax=Nitrospirillum sp. BR 11828 TaxID=3104325 RepID=UPI002ACA3501|nr:hypothetical protein [Nitrospirillum sp. BR 11828]MDZ5646747.1 hypothetical protein [Nitrospirillum sp. BR 11828]